MDREQSTCGSKTVLVLSPTAPTADDRPEEERSLFIGGEKC